MPEPTLALRKRMNILFALLVVVGLYCTSMYSYLLFHTLAELFSIVVAWGIFVVAANSWRFHENEYLSFVGLAYLFVGGLDLIHALSYKGMGVFPGYGANLPTQLWIAARYLESLSLLIAPLFLRHRLRPNLVFAGYAAVTAALLLSVFHGGIFPDCYLEGTGLTAFKRASEYIISIILLLAVLHLFRHRDAFDRSVFNMLVASIIVTIASELAFTLYSDVYGLLNLIGHYLKLLSFYLVYKALVQTGIVKPYDLLFRDLKQSEEALRSENEELDAFAHTVAHDLKGPLTLITGFADLLVQDRDGMTDQQQQQCLRAILQNGHRMGDIISELLLLAQVRRHRVEMTPLDMSYIVSEVLERLDHEIQERSAEIIVPATWPVTLGHAAWVEEIWYNYLGNALKYGGHRPHIELGAEALRGDMVRFWVKDNGLGIGQQDQCQLFTPFTRLSQVRTEGHGLGLSIVARIAEKLGGTVGVESEVGQGSTFWFTMPGTHSHAAQT